MNYISRQQLIPAMNPPTWLARNVSKLLPTAGKASTVGALRSTQERLATTLSRKGEALSPRQLRRVLADLQGVADSQVSEVEGGQRAMDFSRWYEAATSAQRCDCWLLMSEQFAPDLQKIQAAREPYEAAQNTPDAGPAEIRLRQALASPRTRLLQRFAVFPQGLRFLLDLRAQLLPHLKTEKRLLALDSELESLFSTWFDVAFLELRRINWDSPASLIEKLIQYEAVHGHSSLRSRRQSHGWMRCSPTISSTMSARMSDYMRSTQRSFESVRSAPLSQKLRITRC